MRTTLLFATLLALASGIPHSYHHPLHPSPLPGIEIKWKLGLFADRVCIAPGDQVTFQWTGDSHNVEEVGFMEI